MLVNGSKADLLEIEEFGRKILFRVQNFTNICFFWFIFLKNILRTYSALLLAVIIECKIQNGNSL
jgi:hypothetical protein